MKNFKFLFFAFTILIGLFFNGCDIIGNSELNGTYEMYMSSVYDSERLLKFGDKTYEFSNGKIKYLNSRGIENEGNFKVKDKDHVIIKTDDMKESKYEIHRDQKGEVKELYDPVGFYYIKVE